MPALQNKQPLFTSRPILVSLQFDPEIPTTLRNPGIDNRTTIYTDETSNGSLITRITVNSTALIGDNVTTKVIYIGVSDPDNTIYSLYASKVMTGISGLTSTDVVPYVEFTFGNGLVTKQGSRIVIAASTDQETTGERGDAISVIVEGGTYDAI
jgi:hypothetical protein